MKTGRRGRGRGARRSPGGRGGWRERGDRYNSTGSTSVVPTGRVEEPAHPCPGRSAPACTDQVLASKQQKANMALSRKGVTNMPLDLQRRSKRLKAAKELYVGVLPGVRKPVGLRKNRHKILTPTNSCAYPQQTDEVKSPSPLHEPSPVTGDVGSDIDEEDQEADDLGVDNPAPGGPPTVATESPAVLPTNFDQAFLDEIDRLNEFEIRKTYRICNFN